MDVYDSFVDPARWPPAEERAALAEIYGWGEEESTRIVHAEYTPGVGSRAERKTPPG